MHCNEVPDLSHALERDPDVGRLQIAMHDGLSWGGFDTVDQLLNDVASSSGSGRLEVTV
jgi:hypothetical protein